MQDASSPVTVASAPSRSTTRAPSVLALYRYSSFGDRMLALFGVVCCLVNGCSMPALSVMFGRLLDTIAATSSYSSAVANAVLAFVVGGCILFATGMLGHVCLNIAASRTVRRVKGEYVHALLRQSMPWHDTHSSGDLLTRLQQVTRRT